MIKPGILISLVTMCALNACMDTKHPKTKQDITKDTLAYTYQTVKARADDCGNKPDTGCTSSKIAWPVFKIEQALNDTVNQKLLNLFLPGNRPGTSLKAEAENFISGYLQYKKHYNGVSAPFILNAYAKVLRQDSSLITLEVGGYSYAGGAHGTSLTRFINWNTKAQKSIILDDLFIDNYRQPLTKIAEQIFRKSENLKDRSSLARDYFFKDNKFALNNNFVITPIGLRFLYNEYEIKPYAAGITDLFIPYAQIKPLLKLNTVITQYIKH